MLLWLRENGLSLLLSLLLSLAVWTVAVRQQNPIEQHEYPAALPVVMQGLDQELVISGDYTREVRVSLRAPRSTWNDLTPDDIAVVADLSGLPPGTHEVPLEVEVPRRIQAVNAQARPDKITLTLEEQRERKVPVQVIVAGQPAIGFGVGEPIVRPDSVTVSGPLSLVDLVSEASIEVDVDDLRDTVRTNLTVSALDSEGKSVPGLQITPTWVQVVVPIPQKPGFKEVAVVVSQEGTPAPGYYVRSIEVSPLSVTVQGPREAINEMPGFVETMPVDLTGLRDNFSGAVGLVLPEGVLPVDFSTVQVEVEIDTFKGSLAMRRSLEVVGLGGGLEAVVSPEEVDVILSGAQPVLDELSEENVHVVLDLTGLSTGTYQIEPEIVALPEGIVSESLLPATIEVRIRPATFTP